MEASCCEVSAPDLAEFFGAHLQERVTLGNVTLDQLKERFTDPRSPTLPISVDEYLDWLGREVLPYAVNVSSKKFIGHMTSALPDFMPELSALVARLNQNMVKVETSSRSRFSNGSWWRCYIGSSSQVRSAVTGFRIPAMCSVSWSAAAAARILRLYGMPEIAHCWPSGSRRPKFSSAAPMSCCGNEATTALRS